MMNECMCTAIKGWFLHVRRFGMYTICFIVGSKQVGKDDDEHPTLSGGSLQAKLDYGYNSGQTPKLIGPRSSLLSFRMMQVWL